MNDSLYAKAVWSRMGKVGKQGRKLMDTGWLDSALGGEEARRQLMLTKIGNAKDYQDKSFALKQDRMDVHRKGLENASRDALTGDILTGISIPISYYEGKNNAAETDKMTERQKKINAGYSGLLGRL